MNTYCLSCKKYTKNIQKDTNHFLSYRINKFREEIFIWYIFETLS